MSTSPYSPSNRGSPIFSDQGNTTSSSRSSSPSDFNRASPNSVAASILSQSIFHAGSSMVNLAQTAFKRACEEVKSLDIDISADKYQALNSGLLHALYLKVGGFFQSSPDFVKLDELVEKLNKVNVKSSTDARFQFAQNLIDLRSFFSSQSATLPPKDRYKLLFNALTGILNNSFYHVDFKSFLNQESFDSHENGDEFEEVKRESLPQDSLNIYSQLSISLEEARGIENFIDTLVETFFLDVDINSNSYPMIQRILEEIHHKSLESSSASSASLRDLIYQDFLALDNLPLSIEGSRVSDKLIKNYNNALGHLDLGFSPMRLTNLVHVLSQRSLERQGGINKDLKVIRMGCPTYTDCKQDCQVEPLFVRFIESSKNKGHKHGYFNLQNDKHKSKHSLFASLNGDETRRIDALKRVAKHFPENFSHFLFPMDNHFWHGNANPGLNFYDFVGKLKELFVDQKGQEGAFSYPSLSDCAREDKTLSTGLFNKVIGPLGILFSSTTKNRIESMNADKQKAFLFISYVGLAQVFVQHYNLDSCNFSCKDGIDRGGTFNALFEYMQELHENREGILAPSTREETLKRIHLNLRLRVNQFSLLVKQQAVVPNRRENFLAAVDFISQHPEEVIQFMASVDENAKRPLA